MTRMEYFLDGNEVHLADMVNIVAKYDLLRQRQTLYQSEKTPTSQDIIDFISVNPSLMKSAALLNTISKKKSKKIVFYSAGRHAHSVMEVFKYYNLVPFCFCDSNLQKAGTTYLGFPVISPGELITRYNDAYVVICTIDFADEIFKFLKDNNFSDNQIFFTNSPEEMYFGLPELQPLDHEVYIDCGCFDGKTIMDFIRFCKGTYKKIYGFEADPDNFIQSNSYIKSQRINNTTILQKGVWGENTTLKFTNLADSVSTFENIDEQPTAWTASLSPKRNEINVPVVTIDSVVNDEPVTFIKMDIEGAELEALKGCVHTIIKNKPRIAMSIYHKPEDILELPLFLLELVPEYKFYLRHYHTAFFETVLYAMI